MKRLGVNQKLHEIFNRVLNKPEHEGKPHQLGDFIFTFNRVTLFNIEREISSPTKITQVDVSISIYFIDGGTIVGINGLVLVVRLNVI